MTETRGGDMAGVISGTHFDRTDSADCRTGRMVPDPAGRIRAGLGTRAVRRHRGGCIRILRLAVRVGRYQSAAGQPHALPGLGGHRDAYARTGRAMARLRAGWPRCAAPPIAEWRPAPPAPLLRMPQ